MLVRVLLSDVPVAVDVMVNVNSLEETLGEPVGDMTETDTAVPSLEEMAVEFDFPPPAAQ